MKPALLSHDLPADVRGWWASEKFDGCRAIWTGTALLTRNGKRWDAPKWFTDGLPKTRLDGELWMGRGTFDELVSTLQRKGSDWSGVRFMVFDAQEFGTFEERQAILHKLELPPHVRLVTHRQLSGHAELDNMERHIVAAGGEGCVIIRLGSKYRPGRTDIVCKVKRLVPDEDRWQG